MVNFLGQESRLLFFWVKSQDPLFFRLDSDLLDFLPYVTLQTSKWHSGPDPPTPLSAEHSYQNTVMSEQQMKREMEGGREIERARELMMMGRTS